MKWIVWLGAAALAAAGNCPAAATAGNTYRFRERLPAAEYDARVAKLPADRIAPDRAGSEKQPIWGVRVLSVKPDGQAQAQGLGVGWVIDRINGKEYWNIMQNLAREARQGAQTVEAVSPDGERRKFSFGPGLLGISMTNAHQTGLYMMQQAPKGAWDRELLIANAAWRDGGQEVSETALHRAVQKGMPPNDFSRYFATQLAADAGDEALSRKLLEALVEKVSENGEVPRFFRPGVRTLALAHGKLELLKANLREMDGVRDDLQPRSVALWEDRLAGAGWPASLLDRAREQAGSDMLPEIVRVEDGWEDVYTVKDPRPLRAGRHLGSSKPPGYEHFVFRTPKPLRNAIFEIRGAYGHVQDPRPFHEISFQLVDLRKRADARKREVWNPSQWVVAGIRIIREVDSGQICWLSGGPTPSEISTQRYFPRLTNAQAARVEEARHNGGKPDLPPESVFKVSLIKSGRSIEVAVNDVSWLRLPADRELADLGCVIHSTGMALAIEEMTLRELPEK